MSGQAFHGLALEHRVIAIMVSSTPGSQTKKPPLIQAPSPSGFSLNSLDQSVWPLHKGSEAAFGLDRGQRHQLTLLLVIPNQCIQVHIADAIAVGQQETLSSQVIAGAAMRPPVIVFSPVSSNVTSQSSLALLVHLHLIVCEIKSDITSAQEEIPRFP